jgi:hypothetical protein
MTIREEQYNEVVKRLEEIRNRPTVVLQLWFDPEEKLSGEGFYPKIDEFKNDAFMKSMGNEDVYIKFRLNPKLQWIQMDNDNIDGLDYPFSKVILEELNRLSNRNGVCIKNRKKQRIASNFWNV